MSKRTASFILVFSVVFAMNTYTGAANAQTIPTQNTVPGKKVAARMQPARLNTEKFSISALKVFPGTDIVITAKTGETPIRTINGRLLVKKQAFDYPAYQGSDGTFKVIIPIPPRMASGNYTIEVDKLYEGLPSETVTFNIAVKGTVQ